MQGLESAIAARLRAGRSQAEIAAELGVSRSTVARHARRLGYARRATRRSRFDWPAIQRWHDAGHSFSECRARFGVSAGAWDAAVTRGDLRPHPTRRRTPPGETRRAVARLLSQGLSQGEIGRRLGLFPSTVSYHVRALGFPAQRSGRRYDWAAVQAYYDQGHSVRDCIARFGFSSKSWHDAKRRGDLVTRPAAMPLEQLLARTHNRGHIKQRLFRLGLKQERCEACGLTEWRGARIGLELHHVNGDGRDNRLENLRILCPNCHSQTDTWGGRNRPSGAAGTAHGSERKGAAPGTS